MIDIKEMSVDDRIMRAKIQMYKRSPFFSYILLHMKMVESTKEKGVPTMAVDLKGNLYWNRSWCENLTEEEIMGVLAHEVLHIALLHLDRGKTKEGNVFNVANDLVVNSILKKDGFNLPSCGAIPDHNNTFTLFKYTVNDIHQKSSEEIYEEIYHLYPKINLIMAMIANGDDGKNGGDGLTQKEAKDAINKIGGFDVHIYGDGDENAEDEGGDKEGNQLKVPQNQRDKWKRIVAEAATLAKQQGKLPAGIERMIENILDSKVDWRNKLYKYIVDQIIHDFSWALPSRRSVGCGVYLPRPVKESVKIVVSIDTSGSIGRDELEQFMGELLSIGQSFPNINVDLIVCDAQVHETYELTKETIDDILTLKMSGGGGTSHKPVYKYIMENITDCKVVINFTDLHTDFPKNHEEIPFDTLWVVNQHGSTQKPPFGDVIRIE